MHTRPSKDRVSPHPGIAMAVALAIVLAISLSIGTALPGTSAFALDCTGVIPATGDGIRAELVTAAVGSPVDAAAPTGDTERLFIVSQPGRIHILTLTDDSVLPEPFLDIRTKVEDGGEKGLLGLAFHPRYAENGYFYLNYTRLVPPANSLETAIVRYQVSTSDPNRADPDSEKEILSYAQPESNHNGGQIAFGPRDGYLYIAAGDGGGSGDPFRTAQDPAALLGKILRIDVDVGDPYGIPETNPFVGDDKVRGEIWAFGTRNPWRVSFDPENGDFYVADVGQGTWEEINWRPGDSPGGENYGWSTREGLHEYSTRPLGPGTLVDPVYEYRHSGSTPSGCSVTGGVVYRGCRIPELRGTYFFADYCNDWVWSLRMVEGVATQVRDRTTELNASLGPNPLNGISSFAVDGRGEAYILSLSGRVYRIVPDPEVGPDAAFLRGDANGDTSVDVSDAVFTLLRLFSGGSAPECPDALDANDDGAVDLSDAVTTLGYLFAGAPALPSPAEVCGADPTEDELSCAQSPCPVDG